MNHSSDFLVSNAPAGGPSVKILVKGYAAAFGEGWKASSTCCLVEASGKKIITDPGCNRELLEAALQTEQLTARNIDFVFLSHGHPDHILLAALFPEARYITYDNNLVYDGDVMTPFSENLLGPGIRIINTPGHVPEHLSLLVETPKETIAVAGDVFWWKDNEPRDVDVHRPDSARPVGMDHCKLLESRKKLLRLADVIIPGHGEMFRVVP